MSPRALTLLLLLLAACDGGDGKGSTGDSAGDTGLTSDTGDTGAPSPDDGCTSSHIDRLSVSEAGGDVLGIVLECEDASQISFVEVAVPELGLNVRFEGGPSDDGSQWWGNSLSELEELVVEKGLSFGMDVSKYNLDEDRPAVVTNTQSIAVTRAAPDIRGYGYAPPEGAENQVPGAPIGEVAIDSIFTPLSAGFADLDGDGEADEVQAWVMTHDPDTGAVGAGRCALGDGSTCAPSTVLEGFEASSIASENPIFAEPSGAHTNVLYAARGTEDTGKGEAAFSVAVAGADALKVGIVNPSRDAKTEALSATLSYSTLGLAASKTSEPDPATVPVVAAVRAAFDTRGSSLSDRLGEWTVSGVGIGAEDGSPVLWGATLKGSTVTGTWRSSLGLATVFPQATRIAGMGTEVIVFFGINTDGELTALSVSASTGKQLSSLSFPGVTDPSSIQGTVADIDQDGTTEIYAAAVGAEGLSVVSGELSSSVGFAKGSVTAIDLPLPGGLRLDGLSTDEAGNLALSAVVSVAGEETGWLATGAVTAEDLGVTLDTLQLDSLGTASRALVSGGGECSADVQGFCGLMLHQPGERTGFSAGAPIRFHSLDWRGDEARGIPLVGTETYTVVATDVGTVQAFDLKGAAVGEPLPVSPTLPLSAFELDGRLHVFGAATIPTDDDLYRAGDLIVASVDQDGLSATSIVAQSDEFQIPEKVVMEKDQDFYGLATGGGGGAPSPTGATVLWTTLSDTDGDGTPDSTALHTARLSLDELAGGGESVRLELGGGTASGGLIGHEVAHVVQQRGPIGPSAVLTARGEASMRSFLRGPLSEGTGATSLGALTDSAVTDDLIAVMPWETGTKCGLATVWVPGTTTDWADNLSGAIVLSTAEAADCSDLAVPVGGLDPDGAGVRWPVLAQRDDDAGTTTFSEVIWDGRQLLQLPGVVVPYTAFDQITTGEMNYDGRDDLFIVPAGWSTALLLQTNGRSLSPVAGDGSDFASNTIKEDPVTPLDALLEEEELAASSRDFSDDPAGPWFWLIADAAGQTLTSSRTTQNSTGTWAARGGIEHSGSAIFPTSWSVILD